MSDGSAYADETEYPRGHGGPDGPTRARASASRSSESVDVPLSAYDMQLVHQASPEPKRYAAWIDGEEAASLPYRLVAGRIVLQKTTVETRYRGKGVATEFIGRVLDELRHNGRLITVYCPLVRSFIDSHPQYAEMVDRGRPGLPSHTEDESSRHPMAVNQAIDEEVADYEVEL